MKFEMSKEGPIIRGIVFAEFHPTAGPKIVFQVKILISIIKNWWLYCNAISASINFFLTGVNDSKALDFGSHALLGGSQKYRTYKLAESSRRISNSIMHCGSCNVQEIPDPLQIYITNATGSCDNHKSKHC